jgi:dolichol-phosphate mannosyltransferase
LRITVVIPTYNEAENLPKIVEAVFTLPLDLHVLVVDDNSPDGTGKIADGLSQQTAGKVQVMHRAGKQGLGTAYVQGFGRALEDGAEAVAQMDADFSHPCEKLVDMSQALENCSVVIGSRYVAGGRLDEHWSAFRKALSSWGNVYARTILAVPLRDVTAGFKMWKRETLLGMPLQRIRSSGYVFQVEMSYVAYRLGYTFKEIPIYFTDRRAGQSKMSLRIQVEAAMRVWQLIGMYRDLGTKG